MYEATHSFLNDRHLSSDADDTGYLLPFGPPAASAFVKASLEITKKIYFKNKNDVNLETFRV